MFLVEEPIDFFDKFQQLFRILLDGRHLAQLEPFFFL